MTHYSYAQLEGLWINAGGDRSLAPLMAAIAEAESSGNSTAENTTDNGGTQTSWGLWQISNGTHNEPVPNILDPAVNARAAVAKYHSQGLGAWGTYTSGAYRAFLNGSTTPATNVPSGGSAGAGSTGGSGSGGGGTAGSNIVLTSTIVAGTCVLPLNIPIAGQFCLLSKSQARGLIGGLLILGGGLLVLPGLLILAAAGLGQTGAGRAAGKAAEAVPTIRVARAASGAARSRRAAPEPAPASPSPRPAPTARPAPRPASRPAAQRTGTRADARGTSPEFRRQFMGESG